MEEAAGNKAPSLNRSYKIAHEDVTTLKSASHIVRDGGGISNMKLPITTHDRLVSAGSIDMSFSGCVHEFHQRNINPFKGVINNAEFGVFGGCLMLFFSIVPDNHGRVTRFSDAPRVVVDSA